MTQNSDSTPQLKWFRPTVFNSRLLLVRPDTSFNKAVAEISHKDGGFVVRVKTANIDDEMHYRTMCREETEHMKRNIAAYVARRLT